MPRTIGAATISALPILSPDQSMPREPGVRPLQDAAALSRPTDLAVPTRLDLFLTFVRIGLCGFGGVGPWARRIIVEDKRWVDEREYAELLGLCQILPGPNVGNVSV